MLNRRDFIRRLVGGGVGIALAPSVLLSAGTAAPTLSPYCPMWYAKEGLEALGRTLRRSPHIHSIYHDVFPIGDTITIRIPERFR